MKQKLIAKSTRILDAFENYVLYTVYEGAQYFILKYIIERYGFKFDIYNPMDIKNFNEYLEKMSIKNVKVLNKESRFERKSKFKIAKIEKDTYIALWFKGTYSLTFNELFLDNFNESETRLIVYVFGKKSKKYAKDIENLLDNRNNLRVFNVNGASSSSRHSDDENRVEFNVSVSDFFPRPMDTLFFDDDIKDRIIDHINKFNSNADIYSSRNLLYKTGILLYGNPGTGKTSLANAISKYTNCNLVVVDINTFNKLDTAELTATLNADNNRYIVLLEDIDTIFDSLDRKARTSENERKVINKLLQLLDSNTSPNNVIFIATTNYYDRLDEAIKRPGRFDIKLEVKPISKKETVIKMCKSFDLDDDSIKDILENNTLPINQSTLQSEILRRIKL